MEKTETKHLDTNFATGTVTKGLDWGVTDTKGTFSPDAVYVLKTNDGADILVYEKGHAPNVQILFETGSPTYAWMNAIVGYASGAPFPDGVGLDVWQVRFVCGSTGTKLR